jgi:hypothetical protein
MTDDGAGGVVETPVKLRVWVEVRAEADTPMSSALNSAQALVRDWAASHPDGYPPTVINITDGQATDGDPRAAAEHIRDVGTSDGQVLLLNCHISAWGGTPTLYPSGVAGLPDAFAQNLFEMSSELPPRLADAATSAGYPISAGARGFGYQADAAALVKFIDIGTRATDLIVVG